MNSHKHENSKNSEATLGIYDIFGQRRKGDGVLDFKTENGQLQIVEEEQNHMAGKPLLGNPETMGHRGYLANRPLPKALLHLPHFIQIWLSRLRRTS